MTHIDTLVAQAELDFGRKFQKAQEVGHSSAFFAYALAKAFLRKLILIYKFLECQGYLYRIQVLALYVLDESHLGQFGIVGRTYIGRNRMQPGHKRGTVATLPGYDLIAVGTRFAQRQRLYDAELSY